MAVDYDLRNRIEGAPGLDGATLCEAFQLTVSG
jgi:hypothetical protein